ncbi:Predicted ATP-dependent endonuclease of the OLD family, contains P-loop ATPase and TOPRIM domains [Cupriavidus sp. YR651]|uniref:ATP-binding protein n=1 Tax=Cupriavidus sp. YR651 TaxID=1855315 RepID=UPI00087E65D0|nr:ATP-binding protein [Cupriavidus sp. YR651]SDD17321.1 Predicted ATP-dependent endonuclease of the OLD family, contains P-loop ATPase and TOPRIM domains [Cupriavidus sp. YR651]
MKLAAVTLENFRGYAQRTRIEIDDLTAFIGKNDAGKSTILEALEIFFNDGKPERGDACVYAAGTSIRIGCAFTSLPSELVLDASARTTLAAEYLLNGKGELEIIKEWDCSGKTPKESVFAVAEHPTNADASDLLTLKNSDLKTRIKKLGIAESTVKLAVNGSMRQAIREFCQPLTLQSTQIPLDKEDAKKVWDALKPQLPMYALFRSDRPSHDGDDEVQSPLKFAITQALKEMADDLKKIEDAVRQRAENVANRTLEKLNEMDSRLARELKPFFKTDPKWDVFKFGLVGDNDIPINKRGSGVRRLILLNFFRAEAERRRTEKGALSVIYAIEEPETSQHPDNQRLLVQALKELAVDENTQVLVTSHTPGLAGLLPSDSLRYVRKQADGTATVSHCNADDLAAIANELGVLPDRRVQVLVFVEGTNDIEFLERVSALLKPEIADVVDFTTDNRVALVPLGGGSLKQWVAKHYLKNLSLPEVHIYDRDDDTPPKYQPECDAVNARGDGSWAVITGKRELENYLHADAISDGMNGIAITFTDACDVPLIVAKAVHESSGSLKPWENVLADPKELSDKISRAKKRLNRDAAAKMTPLRLAHSDALGEVSSWLRSIHAMLA